MLLQVASSINEDTTQPLRVPVLTIRFLHLLGRQCDHSTKPLGRFLLLIPHSRLVDEIGRLLLPSEFWESRAERERLQRLKEEAVANQEWERAAAIRDQGYSLLDRLRQMSEGNTIDVQPDHILQAIANLGFDGEIDLTG
jgi:UvrB/uvrC motif.